MSKKELAVQAFNDDQLKIINNNADKSKEYRLNILEERKALGKIRSRFFKEAIPGYDKLAETSRTKSIESEEAKLRLGRLKQAYAKIFAEVLALVHYRDEENPDYPCKAKQLAKKITNAVRWLRFIEDPILDDYLKMYGIEIIDHDSELDVNQEVITGIFEEADNVQSTICENSDMIKDNFKAMGFENPDIAYNKNNKAGLKVNQFQEITTIHAIKSLDEEKSQKKISDKYNTLINVTAQNNAVIDAALKVE